jgi:hypothetical protein
MRPDHVPVTDHYHTSLSSVMSWYRLVYFDKGRREGE